MNTYPQTHWNLADLFPAPDSPELQAALDEMENVTVEIENVRPLLTDDMSAPIFLEIVAKLDRLKYLAIKLDGYAYLFFSEDNTNQAAVGLTARVKEVVARSSNRVLFFDLWWKTLEDHSANRLMDTAGIFCYWLESMRRLKQHTLTEPEEKIINIKNVTGSSTLIKLYSTMSNQYTYKFRVDGEEKVLTRGEIMNYMRDKDPELRAASYQVHYGEFAKNGLILGQIYQTLACDWRNEHVQLRKHPRPISVRNRVNDIPDEVVDTLLAVARKNTPVFQRYFRLKAKRLGMDRLCRYDLLAPITQCGKTYTFEEASGIVLDSFRQFDPHFGELAERVYQEKHLDAEIRSSKSYLPFCYNAAHKTTPYININFQGRVVDVSTMQHELGHAIHSMLAVNVPTLMAYPCLPLAETASTFSEMILVDYLLAHETDADARRDLLFGQVDHNYTAIQRQAFTAMFECRAHEMVHEGASVDQMADAYLEGLKTQFGDSMDVSDEFRWEWVAYPHIYEWPFYVYAYSFGQLLVLALYQQYKLEGEAFKPKYFQMLSAGGSESPMALLEKLGIDPRQASFWQSGYDVIDQMITKLESVA
jgi:oligoendopeptidase F